MNGFKGNGLYEIKYRGSNFSFLEFIRMDRICNVCYLTLRNIITGEMYTFEESEITGIHEAGERGSVTAAS